MLKYPRVKSYQPIGTVADFPYVRLKASDRRRALVRRLRPPASIPWLNELVPPGPCSKMPRPSLAQKLSLKSGDWVNVSSARGELTVKAVVTPRMKSLQIDGREVTVVWMPYNWGYKGLSTESEREPHHDRCQGESWRWNPGDRSLLGQCGSRHRLIPQKDPRSDGEDHDPACNRDPDQDYADRHHQVHRLSRMSGCLQAVE